jgi:hypothetical protein
MDINKLAEIFEAVKVMPLRPGDIVVFRTQYVLSEDVRARLSDHLKSVFGAERTILLLGGGDNIDVVRPELATASGEPKVDYWRTQRVCGKTRQICDRDCRGDEVCKRAVP